MKSAVMKEKNLYTPFSHYIASKYRGSTAVFELKLVRGGKLREYDFKPHQLRAMKMAKHQAIYFKPPDTSLTPSPCDAFYIKKSEAYGVIFFMSDPKLGYFIDIDVLLQAFKDNKKGIDEGTCNALAEFKDYL